MVPKWSPRGAQGHPFDDSCRISFFIWGPFGLLWRPLGARVAKMTPRVSKWSPGTPKSDVWGTPGASEKSNCCRFRCLFSFSFLLLLRLSVSPPLSPGVGLALLLGLGLGLGQARWRGCPQGSWINEHQLNSRTTSTDKWHESIK